MPRPVWLDAWLLPRKGASSRGVEGKEKMGTGSTGSDGRRKDPAGMGVGWRLYAGLPAPGGVGNWGLSQRQDMSLVGWGLQCPQLAPVQSQPSGQT